MNIVSDSNRYQDLSEESRIEQHRHAEVLRQFEIKKRARSINVPTAPEDVKRSLREFNQPATLFGEDHADRRERLREVIAGMQISGEESAKVQVGC
jgi:U4/U6 small nuclear ribonucleoprotein PRP4